MATNQFEVLIFDEIIYNVPTYRFQINIINSVGNAVGHISDAGRR